MAKNDLPEDFDPDNVDPDDPEGMRNLRAWGSRNAEKANKVDVLERENAALRAGVDTSTRKGQAWLASYAGKLDDVEAMLADAREFDPAIIRGAAPTPTSGDAATTDPAAGQAGEGATTAPVEPTGSQARQNLADGATPGDAATEDVRQGSLARAEESLKHGAPWENAVGEMIRERAHGVSTGSIPTTDQFGRPVTPAA